MPVSVEYTNEFEAWWDTLPARQQHTTSNSVDALIREGVNLGFPYSSAIKSSRHPHMRELRVQTRPPIRVFYAFDPRRSAILLIGGHKTTDDGFYRTHVHRADALYDDHLRELRLDPLPRSNYEGPTR